MGTTIRERTSGRWVEILTGLGVSAHLLDGKHHACPACGGTDRFRYVRDDNGGFFCGDQRGSGVDLVMHLRDCDFPTACREVERIVGRDASYTPADRKPNVAALLFARAKRATRSRYIESRGLEIAPALRWLDRCDYYDGDRVTGTYAAMVAPVTDREGAFRTVHITYLDRGAKAKVQAPRKIMPGHVTGCAVALYPPAEVMGVAEGIETAIAAKLLHNMPVHAALNAGMMAKWNWPQVAREVHIFADNDTNYAGQAAAYQLAHRLAVKGLRAVIRLPEQPGDWNDVLLATRAVA